MPMPNWFAIAGLLVWLGYEVVLRRRTDAAGWHGRGQRPGKHPAADRRIRPGNRVDHRSGAGWCGAPASRGALDFATLEQSRTRPSNGEVLPDDKAANGLSDLGPMVVL